MTLIPIYRHQCINCGEWEGSNDPYGILYCMNCINETKQVIKNKDKSMTTKVKCQCISKKESQNWDKNHPIQTAIELQVPYDQNSIYFQMSGGTALTLNTVNKAAADMFVIGKDYDIVISPSED